MKVLIWATTLQADILALALYLDARDDVDLMVVTEHRAAFLREPIARVRPLRAPVMDRDASSIERSVRSFAPDVVVADNHLPVFLNDVPLFAMWHGLGWKARGRKDIDVFAKNVKRLTGDDPREPSSRFRAQCYGEKDRAWRVEQWGLDPASCVVIGSCYSDLLLAPPYTREELQPHYDVDILGRKVVLLSIGWHYGRILARNWDRHGLLRSSEEGLEQDLDLLRAMLETIHDEDASCVLCLHDRKRYEKSYLDALMQVVARFDRVAVKHKDDHPDNLTDLVVADVMVSNLSSFITFFYYSRRPSVHIIPARPDDEQIRLAKVQRGRVAYRKVRHDEPLYMNDPRDNGGLSASTLEEVQLGIARGLREPTCCEERAAAWLRSHVHAPDGHTSARFYEAIRAFVRGE